MESETASFHLIKTQEGITPLQGEMSNVRKTIILLLMPLAACAQQSLKIDRGVTFQLTGDTFLLDSLVMDDGSVLLLDGGYTTCLIRAGYFAAGKDVEIIGIGRDGKRGRDGADAANRSLDLPGKDGTSGAPGLKLTLNFSSLALQSKLEIRLTGGRGGDGGHGGSIYQHAATSAAERPTVGPGGSGGDGGNGGDLIIGCPSDLEKTVRDKIVTNAQGGAGGKSGTPPELKTPAWYYQDERNGVPGHEGKVTVVYLKR